MSELKVIDVVSTPSVGRTTFLQSIGTDYSCEDRQEFSHDYNKKIMYVGNDVGKHTPTQNRSVILLFDINETSSYENLHDLAKYLRNNDYHCVAFGNKLDIFNQPFDFSICDNIPLIIPLYLGSALKKFNTGMCVQDLLDR